MTDQDEIGRPNYSAHQTQQSASTRPVPPSSPRNGGGSVRIRAVLAAVCAAYAWTWLFDIYHTPLWSALLAAAVAIRLGLRSRDLGASETSIVVANIAWLAGAVFYLYVLMPVGYQYFVEHASIGDVLNELFASS